MVGIEKEFENEFISEDEIKRIKTNIKIISSIIPNCRTIKQENEKLLETFLLYDLKLQRLKNSLDQIETDNKRIQRILSNKTKLFEELRMLLIKSEIKDEYFDSLESLTFTSDSDLVKIQEALDVFMDYKKLKYDLRIVYQRQEAIDNSIKRFLGRFKFYYKDMLGDIRPDTSGKLGIHSFLYQKVGKFDFIFKFCAQNADDILQTLNSIYLNAASKIYTEEFEKNFSILGKVLHDKTLVNGIESIKIVFKCIFMILKCELNFCMETFIPTGYIEFCEGLFKHIFHLLYVNLDNFLRQNHLKLSVH